MPRFDPSPWNLGLPVCVIAAGCGPVIPLEPMGPTSLGETDPNMLSTTDDGASMDAAGCNPQCAPGYVCDAGVCVPEYGCLEFGCCYYDPCCGEGGCCDDGGYGCYYCYAITDCGSGAFCEYQFCVQLDVPPECEVPLDIVEILGPTSIGIDNVFSLAFVESDGDAGRELVVGDFDGAVLIGGPGEPEQVLPVPEMSLVEDLAVADFDVDGREDIALSVTPQAGTPQLLILRGIGEDEFTLIDPGTSPTFDIEIADVDGDSLPDIVGALEAGVEYRPLGVLRNLGGFGFEQGFLAIDAQPLDIDAGDLDANGYDDVVGVDNEKQQLWFGGSPFDTAEDWTLLDVPYLGVQTVMADFDGNEYDDLVRLTNIQGWTLVDSWVSTPEGLFESPEWGLPNEVQIGMGSAGDLDGDGRADLVHVAANVLTVRYGAEQADLFGCSAHANLSMTPYLLAIGDFDGNGIDDVAVSDNSTVHVYAAPAMAPP